MCAITIFGINQKIDICNIHVINKKAINSQNLPNILKNLNNNTIIVGDLNLKHLNWNPNGDYRCDGESEALIEFLSEKQINIINDCQIMRITSNDNRESAIDLGLVSSKLQSNSDFNVIDNSFGSDHLPIIITVNFLKQLNTVITKQKWNFKKTTKENWIKFKKICNIEFEEDIYEENIENYFCKYYSKLEKILNKTVPKPKNTDKRKPTVPWWTKECTLAIKKRENLRKRMRQSKNQMDTDVFIQGRRDTEYTLRQAKRKGWQTFCSGINDKTNWRDLLNFIRKIKGIAIQSNPPFKKNDAITTNPKEKASLLVKHYEKSAVMTIIAAVSLTKITGK